MSSYKVTYFDFRGRGELARLCLVYAGQDFEDKRMSKEGPEWGEMKPNTMPPYIPVLEVDGIQLGESCLIGQYIAQKNGFGGDSDEDKHIVTSYVYYIDSLASKLINAELEKDVERKKAQLIEFATKTAPAWLEKCEAIVAKNAAGVMYGSKITTADIHFFNVIFTMKQRRANFLEGKPALSALYDKVANEPKIAEWVAKQPATPF